MASDSTHIKYSSHALLEFYKTSEVTGAICALLSPAIRAKMKQLDSGQVLEVRVDDPSAREDILSWSRLSGNELLAVMDDQPQIMTFYLRKK
jgi:TusA-related sulfurtransferase